MQSFKWNFYRKKAPIFLAITKDRSAGFMVNEESGNARTKEPFSGIPPFLLSL
jgi:hypothetical protein